MSERSLLEMDWEDIDQALVGPKSQPRYESSGFYRVLKRLIPYETLSRLGCSLSDDQC